MLRLVARGNPADMGGFDDGGFRPLFAHKDNHRRVAADEVSDLFLVNRGTAGARAR